VVKLSHMDGSHDRLINCTGIGSESVMVIYRMDSTIVSNAMEGLYIGAFYN
jgi:hypothetical protein